MTVLRLLCVLAFAQSAFAAPRGVVAVGAPEVLADAGGYTSCVFIGPGVAGWQSLSIICSRVNEAAFAEEMWRIPVAGEHEPELIGYGRQPTVRGQFLAWVGTEPGAEGIWLRDLAAEDPPRRVSTSQELSWPSIAADGQTIACYYDNDRTRGIQLVNVADGKANWLVNRGESQPVYSPDGQRMLILKTGQVWVLTNPVMEQAQEERVTDAAYEQVDASWGPAGEWITYIGRWTAEASNVAMLYLPTKQLTWVTEGMSAARSPAISPDGRLLAYIAACSESNAVYLRPLELGRGREPRAPTQGPFPYY